jgi:hypothetical protein
MKQEEMSTGRYLLIIAVVSVFSLLVYIAWITAPNYKGYCKITHSYLTDKEKINIAVKSVMSTYPPSVEVFDTINNKKNIYWVVPERPLSYGSVKEFLEINPSCCEVSHVDDNNYISSVFIYRAMGKLSALVNIVYKVRYYDGNGYLVEKNREEVVAITNCGKAWYP